MLRGILVLLALLTATEASAQVRQSGNVTARHAACWTTSGVIQDCGSAVTPFATSFGTWGSGPTFCASSDIPSTAAGWQRICLGATTSGGTLYLNNLGSASAGVLSFNINGTDYPFPFTSGGVVGPGTTTVGHVAIWNNTAGTLLAQDVAAQISNTLTVTGLLKLGPTPATSTTDGVALFSKNSGTCPQHDPTASAGEVWLLQMCGANATRTGFGIDTFGEFGVIDFRRTNGTPASPTPLLVGDFIGVAGALGRTTTGYSGGAAQIRWYAAENWSDAANGAYLSFVTTPNGGAFGNIHEVLRLDQDRSTNVFGSLVVNAGAAASPAVGATLPTGPSGTIVNIGNIASANSVVLNSAWGISNTPVFNVRFARGSSTSPSAAQSGDIAGVIAGILYGTSQFGVAAGQLRFVASENQTNAAIGQRVEIHTTASGGTTLAEAVRINASGGVGVGTTTDPGVGNLLTNKYLQSGAVAVGSLPTCNSGAKAARYFVTDSNAASYTAGIGAIVAAGGTTNVPVVCDGTNWRIG